MRLRAGLFATKIDMQMTPMIDVVFQLLIFFMLTYKPRLTETAFLIALPAPGVQARTEAENDPDPAEPLLESLLPDVPIRLVADGQGKLAGIEMGNRPLASVAELRTALEAFLQSVQGRSREKVKVEIEPDANLRYEYIVEIIGAATGAGIERVDLGAPRSADDAPAPRSGSGN